MYMYKYLYGIHVNVHYSLTRSSTIVTIVLNIVRVDGWGICRRIKSYNGLPIITEMSECLRPDIESVCIVFLFTFIVHCTRRHEMCLYINTTKGK